MKKQGWALILITLLFSKSALCELLVYPYRATLDPQNKSLEIKITNNGKTSEQYRLSLIQREIINGSWENVSQTPAHSAKNLIKFSPKTTTLAPGQTQTVRIFAKNFKGVRSLEKRSHLLIRQQPKSDEAVQLSEDAIGGTVSLLYGVSIPVIVRGNDEGTSAQISAISNQNTVEVTLNRSGPHSLHGSLTAIDNSGNVIGKLQDISVHVPYSSEQFLIDIKNPSAPKPWSLEYSDLDGRDISARVQIP
ncbi:MAG: molecular chaperone [Gammaproteobacteria bacterium]|nr:molecular chaperone [Gammaproteobacteria bacterium]